jgi:undecaprenyl phosphate N,N'-diacetylbacillosamine 1-phosphate transferase
MNLYKTIIKSSLDIIMALIAFVIFLPLFIIILVILTITYKGNPFYFQKRPGKNENIFKIIKFKTMKDVEIDTSESMTDMTRITKLGGFLRKYSLDEIPQLINVIKGDMSIVGPRPLLVSYLNHYNDYQKQRHNVKPGITGWAQVNGRNNIDWDSRFKLDVWYVDNISFSTDMKILWLTLFKIFNTNDVYNEAQQINKEFKGSN